MTNRASSSFLFDSEPARLHVRVCPQRPIINSNGLFPHWASPRSDPGTPDHRRAMALGLFNSRLPPHYALLKSP
jgi:hypothetical protein